MRATCWIAKDVGVLYLIDRGADRVRLRVCGHALELTVDRAIAAVAHFQDNKRERSDRCGLVRCARDRVGPVNEVIRSRW